MKRIQLTTMLLLAAIVSLAQDVAPDTKKFYIKGGYTMPAKNFYGITDTAHYRQFWKDRTIKGGNLELGSIFTIDRIKLGDKIGIGIDVNYLTLNYMMDNYQISTTSKEVAHVFSIGSAVGPIVTYNATKSIAFDLFFKVNPVWLSGAITTSSDQYNPTSTYGYLGFEGMKYKMGFNARFDFLVISAEFNPGYSILQDYDYPEYYLGTYDETNVEEADLKKTPLPVFNFNIGFCF